MVSLEKYVKTFIGVMPNRGIAIRSLVSKKRAIDAKFLKTGVLNDSAVQELLIIIGKNEKLFFFEDKEWKRTLRHTLGKCIKSMDAYNHTFYQFSSAQYLNKNEFLERHGNSAVAYRRMQEYTPKIKQFLEEFYQDAQRIPPVLRSIDKVYSIQYSSLKINNFSTYKEYVEQEQKYVQELTELLKPLASRQKSLLNLARLFIDEFTKSANADSFEKDFVPWVMSCTAAFIFIFLLVVVSELVGQGWIKNPEQPLMAAFFVTAGGVFVASILTSINTFRLNPIENLLLAIEQFIKKAV